MNELEYLTLNKKAEILMEVVRDSGWLIEISEIEVDYYGFRSCGRCGRVKPGVYVPHCASCYVRYVSYKGS